VTTDVIMDGKAGLHGEGEITMLKPRYINISMNILVISRNLYLRSLLTSPPKKDHARVVERFEKSSRECYLELDL
jgi:hypothetical protein